VPEALPIFEIGIVLLAAALAGMASRRIGLPAVLGYLVVGLAVGPFTPGYVADRHQIQVLADVGVVLLLFEVGIELDLRALAREPRGILVAVPLQVALVTAGGSAAFLALGSSVLGAVTLGFAVALSSSVVVVNISRSRKRTTDQATDRALVVWAILQDAVTLVGGTVLAVLLAQAEEPPAVALGKAIAFVGVAALVQLVALPWLLRRTREQPDIAVAREPGVLVLLLVLVALKAPIVAGLAALFDVPARRLQLGVGLAQIGEFSFVVAGLGLAAGVVTSGQFSATLAAAALTIAMSAVGARLFPKPAV